MTTKGRKSRATNQNEISQSLTFILFFISLLQCVVLLYIALWLTSCPQLTAKMVIIQQTCMFNPLKPTQFSFVSVVSFFNAERLSYNWF